MEEFDRAKATALFKAGLGKAEGEFIASMVTPIYWYHQTDRGIAVRNGSIFFIDCGEGCIGVTAAHVVEGYRQDVAEHPAIICQIGHDLIVNLDERLIDVDHRIDIATLRISADEVARLGKIVYKGVGTVWPPNPPAKDRGIIFAGWERTPFPHAQRNRLRVVQFGRRRDERQ
jgi:hypothetical protein